jgi:peptide/nickel transport system permease protein
MTSYALRRILLFFPVAIGVTAIVFLVIRFAPGDPVVSMLGLDYSPEQAAQLRATLGLDEPIPVQYGLWLGRVIQGDLGSSYFTRQPVLNMVMDRLPNTLALAGGAMTVALITAVPAGIVAATRKDTAVDNISRVIAIVGVSIPVFWLGLIFLIIFSVGLRWFPLGGGLHLGLSGMVLPSLTLGAGFAALIMRMLRSSMIEVLEQDYIRTARSKGLRRSQINYGHALKNATIPVITVVGLQLGILLGGTVLTETVFNIPGLGRLLVESINRRDYTVMQGCVLFIAFFFVIANLVVDLLYAFIDPRIRYR